MSVDVDKVLEEMQQAVNKKYGLTVDELLDEPIDNLRKLAEGLAEETRKNQLTLDGLKIGGDTLTTPLFSSLRTGILNELYEAENEYLERIKEKDARIEELEKEIAEQKEKAKVVVQLDANSISEIVNKAISEVAGEPHQPTPGLIVYEGKTYRKTNRAPQVGDVVIITEFDAEEGTWTRRVSDHDHYYSKTLFLDLPIDGETQLDIGDDKIAAVYAPFNEGTTYA